MVNSNEIGGGGIQIWRHYFRGGVHQIWLCLTRGEGGIKNPQKRPDVIYGCPQSNISSSIYLLLLYLESRIFSKKSYNTVSYTPVELRKIFANILSVVWLHFLFGGGFAAPNFQSLVQFDVKLDLHRRIYLFTYYSRKLLRITIIERKNISGCYNSTKSICSWYNYKRYNLRSNRNSIVLLSKNNILV